LHRSVTAWTRPTWTAESCSDSLLHGYRWRSRRGPPSGRRTPKPQDCRDDTATVAGCAGLRRLSTVALAARRAAPTAPSPLYTSGVDRPGDCRAAVGGNRPRALAGSRSGRLAAGVAASPAAGVALA